MRLIISSATLDAEKFKEFYSDINKNAVSCISVKGRMFPVDVFYLHEPYYNYVEAVIETVVNIHTKEPPGDILVFMTGREEIESVISGILTKLSKKGPVNVLPLCNIYN